MSTHDHDTRDRDLPPADGEVWVVITTDPATGAITDLEVLSQPPAWDLAALGQVCRTGYVNGGDSVAYTQQRRACDWCGETDPLVDSDTRESYPVEVTGRNAYHAPCRESAEAPHRETYPHP
jgi:hypothetical protein